MVTRAARGKKAASRPVLAGRWIVVQSLAVLCMALGVLLSSMERGFDWWVWLLFAGHLGLAAGVVYEIRRTRRSGWRW